MDKNRMLLCGWFFLLH